MNSSLSSNVSTGSLFGRVMMMLTGSMAVAALGAFVGGSIITSGIALLVIGIIWLLGTFGVAYAAKKVDDGAMEPAVGIGIMGVWMFFSGLFIGPALAHYVAVLGGSTVMLAFLGTSGVMAGCGAIGVLSGRNFSGLGKFLSIALLGLILVGIVNIFVAFSTGVEIAYCLIGMAIFAGFFIVDFFRIKENANSDSWGGAMMITMSLYLDFVNFLLFFLRLLEIFLGKGDSKK